MLSPAAAASAVHLAHQFTSAARQLNSTDLGAIREEPALVDFGETIRSSLEDGSGAVVLRGFPVDSEPSTVTRVAYWVLMCAIGMPVYQSAEGELMMDIRDVSEESSEVHRPTLRLARSRQALPFHTDRCDVVGTLCLSEADSGGASRVASTVAVYEDLRARKPAVLEHLLLGTTRRLPSGRNQRIPVITVQDGLISSQFSATYAAAADNHSFDARALAEVSASAARNAWSMDLRRGDIQLLNSHVTLHARDPYSDTEATQRHLLRVWLSVANSRPISKTQEVLWGSVEPGAIRGGVPTDPGGARSPFDAGQRVTR